MRLKFRLLGGGVIIIQGAVASVFIAGVFYFITGDDSSTKKIQRRMWQPHQS
jgi:hypothetical protein